MVAFPYGYINYYMYRLARGVMGGMVLVVP